MTGGGRSHPRERTLLGLVKHLADEEYGYLGASFERPPAERPTWFRDDVSSEVDMWATPDESSEYIVSVYRRACSHADATIRELAMESPGRVAHWGDAASSLGALLILMVQETAAHGGHADIVRELIDGRIGTPNRKRSDDSDQSANAEIWRRQRADIQTVAERFHQ